MLDAEAAGLENQRTQAESTGGVEPSGRADPAPAITRRKFVSAVGKKALYMAPVIVTLTAPEAMGAPGSGNCYPVGSPCTAASDCCEFLGNPLDCQASTCCVGLANECNESADCCPTYSCMGNPKKCTPT